MSDPLEKLTSDNESERLQAALAIGTACDRKAIHLLVDRCAVEPDFYVRDMLTWALTRMPSEEVIPLVLKELESSLPQARSQALHTLSKIKEPSTWRFITTSHIRDPDDEVARAAWRAAVALAPESQKGALAAELSGQLGRGAHAIQHSLSRALIELGENAIATAIQAAQTNGTIDVMAHALATKALFYDPSLGFEAAIYDAKRMLANGEM